MFIETVLSIALGCKIWIIFCAAGIKELGIQPYYEDTGIGELRYVQVMKIVNKQDVFMFYGYVSCWRF